MPANIEPEAPSILPEILPSVGAENEKEEENSDVDISDVRGGFLDTWNQHEQYSMGMRLASGQLVCYVAFKWMVKSEVPVCSCMGSNTLSIRLWSQHTILG